MIIYAKGIHNQVHTTLNKLYIKIFALNCCRIIKKKNFLTIFYLIDNPKFGVDLSKEEGTRNIKDEQRN